ncbi:MAG: hypothetical protein QOE59_574 [Actinomycetota bacterium]|jgi:hypothetical protein|nr:hypothetical protein [Actinomycetota bacterium]
MLGMPTWPPPDTDRNRFLFRLGFPIGVLASAYVLVFALVSNGWLPFVVAVLLIAATLTLGIGLLLMRAQRLEGRSPEPEGLVVPEAPDMTAGTDDVGAAVPAVRPRPRPRPAPNAR